MKRRPPRSTRTDPLFPYTTLSRSTTVVYADRFVPDDEKKRARETGEDAQAVPFLKRFTVFNAQQCENLPEELAVVAPPPLPGLIEPRRSEEHTSELQSLMRISYAVFCLKKKNNKLTPTMNTEQLYFRLPHAIKPIKLT